MAIGPTQRPGMQETKLCQNMDCVVLSHNMDHEEKEVLLNLLKCRSQLKKRKLKDLPKRQNDISQISVLLLQYTHSCFVSSSYRTFSVQKLELWIQQTTETGGLKFWMQQKLQATMHYKDV